MQNTPPPTPDKRWGHRAAGTSQGAPQGPLSRSQALQLPVKGEEEVLGRFGAAHALSISPGTE